MGPGLVWSEGRKGHARMLRIHVDPREGLASELMARVMPAIEQALGVDLEQKYGRTVASEDLDAAQDCPDDIFAEHRASFRNPGAPRGAVSGRP